MSLGSLDKLLQEELKDLYSAESQILKALPKIIKKASSETLQEALESHRKETEGQVERLQKMGKILDIKLTGKKCEGMEGLLSEGEEALEKGGEDSVLDAAIIAGCQKVEHYEIASYGTARAIAQQLGQEDIAELLQETLDEEGEANKKLTEVAEGEIYPHMMEAGEEDEEEEERSSRSRRNGRRRAKATAGARRR